MHYETIIAAHVQTILPGDAASSNRPGPSEATTRERSFLIATYFIGYSLHACRGKMSPEPTWTSRIEMAISSIIPLVHPPLARADESEIPTRLSIESV